MKRYRIAWWAVFLCFALIQPASLHAEDDEQEAKKTARPPDSKEKEGRAARNDANRQEKEPSDSGKDFYRVIVENNLFRSLGWRRPKRDPEYALIGTWIESNGAIAKALVMERRSNELYYVSVGEKVGEATVETIEGNQISLNVSGKVQTLKTDSMQFLAGSGGKSGGGSSSKSGASPDEKSDGPGANRANRNMEGRGGESPDSRSMRDRFRNASPAERRELMQQLRRGGGRRGGREVRIRRRSD